MNQIYKIKCKKCSQKTEHTITAQSRNKGVKLCCVICRTEFPHWINLKSLENQK